MGEDLVKVCENIASVMKKLESIGRLRNEIEELLKSEVRLGEVNLTGLPRLKLKLDRERPLDDTTIGRLLQLLWSERVKLREVGLETYGIGARLLVWIAMGQNDVIYYEVEFEKRGPVRARLIELLALTALDEEDWRAIAAFLEEREAALGEMLERLKNALAALKVVFA